MRTLPWGGIRCTPPVEPGVRDPSGASKPSYVSSIKCQQKIALFKLLFSDFGSDYVGLLPVFEVSDVEVYAGQRWRAYV